MSLFDWMFEGAVELPVRKWPEGLERSLGEIRDEIARAKAAAEVPRTERAIGRGDSSRRYKTRIDINAAAVLRTSIKAAQTFGQEVRELVKRNCDGRATGCYKRAGLSRQTYSHLVSHPKSGVVKETVLRIARGLQTRCGIVVE